MLITIISLWLILQFSPCWNDLNSNSDNQLLLQNFANCQELKTITKSLHLWPVLCLDFYCYKWQESNINLVPFTFISWQSQNQALVAHCSLLTGSCDFTNLRNLLPHVQHNCENAKRNNSAEQQDFTSKFPQKACALGFWHNSSLNTVVVVVLWFPFVSPSSTQQEFSLRSTGILFSQPACSCQHMLPSLHSPCSSLCLLHLYCHVGSIISFPKNRACYAGFQALARQYQLSRLQTGSNFSCHRNWCHLMPDHSLWTSEATCISKETTI